MIIISAPASRTITAEAPASADGSETGGILLGHDAGDRIQVTTAGSPGPAAARRADRFQRDLAHAQRLADDAYTRDRSVWIGEWHTHPLGPAEPSQVDMDTYAELLGDEALGFTRLVTLIATPCPTHGWVEIAVTGWIVSAVGARRAPIQIAPAEEA